MKRILAVLLAGTLSLSLCACGSKETVQNLEPPADPKPAAEAPAGISNPVHPGSAEDVAAATGITMTAPDGAEDVSYASIDGTPALAQMKFTWNGADYCCRVRPGAEAQDISGMYFSWSCNDAAKVGGCSAELHWNEGAEGIITWFDAAHELNYSLSMDTGAGYEPLFSAGKALYAPGLGNEGPDSFAADFSAALAEFRDTCRPGTAGASLRAAAFAAKLADLFTDASPTPEAVAAGVEGFTETLNEDDRQLFPRQLSQVAGMFRQLTAEETAEGLLSACGYIPTHESWDTEALTPLFDAMQSSIPVDELIGSLLTAYVTAINAGADRSAMEENGLNALAADVGDTPLETIGYLVDDLDGNGSPELVIGTISDNNFLHALILDLYTFPEDTLENSDGRVLLFRSRERDRLYSGSDRIFAHVGSSGAADSIDEAFILEDGRLNPAEGRVDPSEYVPYDLTPLSKW